MRCVLGPGKGEVAACDVEEVTIPPHVYTGPGEQLFDFLARALSTFIDKHQVRGRKRGSENGEGGEVRARASTEGGVVSPGTK